jgi:hypothetical protein
MTSQVTNAAKDAKRAALKGWRAAEEFVDGVSYTIRKQPLKCMGITFGVAVGFGALAGWLGTRK